MFLKEGLGDEREDVNNFGKIARFSYYKRVYLQISNKYARTNFSDRLLSIVHQSVCP